MIDGRYEEDKRDITLHMRGSRNQKVIYFEYDEEEENIVEDQNGNYLINGLTPLEDIEEKLEISFDDEALKKIAAITHRANEKVEDIGARRLHTVIERVLEDISFECESGKTTITAELVGEKLADVAQNQDLAKYIL